MLTDVIDRFCERAPAAMLFRGMFSRVFSADRLNEIFVDHKQHQVESDLLFSSLVDLVTPVVAGSKRSVHASYQDHEKELGVSKQAVYDKLRRVEPTVSAALVRIPAVDLGQMLHQARATQADPIPGYHTFAIDGKRLNGTEHRLEETRFMNSSPLPGTVLAMLDTRLGLFVDVACHPDAYACERKVVLPILQRLEKGALYLADRNFCDGPLIEQFLRAETFFIVRHHGRSPRWRKITGSRQRKVGNDLRGGTVYEQDIEVQLPDGSWKRLRRITVRLKKPTRDGETEIHVLTNLPPSVTATAIANGYANRWTIETCLGHVAQALNAEINTLAYPGAALLCFCLALVAFNILSTVKSLMSKYATKSSAVDLSYYYLATEIAEARLGMEITIDGEYWGDCANWSTSEFLEWAKQIVKQADLRRYRKHPRGPKHPPPKRTSGKRRAHVSVDRILQQRKSLA